MNDQNYIIRPYKPSDEISINDNFNKVFGLKRSLEEWRWKMQPENNSSVIMIAVDDSGKVLAHYAGIKVLFQVDGQEVTHLHSIDSFSLKTKDIVKERVFFKTYDEFGNYFCGSGPRSSPWFYGSNRGRIQKLGKLKLQYTEPVPIPYLYKETNILIRPFGMLFGQIIWNWHLKCSKSINFESMMDWITRHYDWCLQFENRLDDYCISRYEEFVSGNTSVLEEYLGMELPGTAQVGKGHEYKIRTKGYGDWKNWFTKEDIELFKPIFAAYMNKYGYADEWEINDPQVISPEHCTEYVMKTVLHKKMLDIEKAKSAGYIQMAKSFIRRVLQKG